MKGFINRVGTASKVSEPMAAAIHELIVKLKAISYLDLENHLKAETDENLTFENRETFVGLGMYGKGIKEALEYAEKALAAITFSQPE